MYKAIICISCQEKFEVVGSAKKPKPTREVTINVNCVECGAVNFVAWPYGAPCFPRRAD
jgi:hypothetical protein